MSTNSLSAKDIKSDWQLVDAKNKILGRLATEVASMLRGKKKANFVPYLDMGDNVVIINAAKVSVSGQKESKKIYFRHSGYPGGVRVETLSDLRKRKPEDIMKHAVWGMMPKGKLGRQMMKKLHIFATDEHMFKEKFKKGKKVS